MRRWSLAIPEGCPATWQVPPRSVRVWDAQDFERPAPKGHTEYRVCTGRTFRPRIGRAVGQAPYAVRSLPRTCRHRNSLTPAQAAWCREIQLDRKPQAAPGSRALARTTAQEL